MNNEYHNKEHLTYRCLYHVIFCPKYRRKVLIDGIDEVVKHSFLETAKKRDFTILEMEVMPDHVHLVIDCNPRYGIMNCVRQLKTNSVSAMKKFNPRLETQLPNIWTRSAFISTVGDVSVSTCIEYVKNQKKV